MSFPLFENLKKEMGLAIDNSVRKKDLYFIAKNIVLCYEPKEVNQNWIAFKQKTIPELQKYGEFLIDTIVEK